MAYKPEIAEDLETGAVLDVELHPANEGDTSTGEKTLDNGIDELCELCDIEEFQLKGEIEAVADKGYHSGDFLLYLDKVGIKPCISEPDRGRRRWTINGAKTPKKLRNSVSSIKTEIGFEAKKEKVIIRNERK